MGFSALGFVCARALSAEARWSASEDIVRRIGKLSELPFDRIVHSIHIGFDQGPTGETAGR
jgi:hypothetical protein